MPYGRPMKNKTRRIPITVHVAVGTLDVIDRYVEQEAKTSCTAYSRSDFFHDAVEAFLQAKGIDAEGEDDSVTGA